MIPTRRRERQVITLSVDPPNKEMQNTTPNPMWLRHLARRSGGQYFSPGTFNHGRTHCPGGRLKFSRTG